MRFFAQNHCRAHKLSNAPRVVEHANRSTRSLASLKPLFCGISDRLRSQLEEGPCIQLREMDLGPKSADTSDVPRQGRCNQCHTHSGCLLETISSLTLRLLYQHVYRQSLAPDASKRHKGTSQRPLPFHRWLLRICQNEALKELASMSTYGVLSRIIPERYRIESVVRVITSKIPNLPVPIAPLLR